MTDMHKRWIQIATAVLCGAGLCASPTTAPVGDAAPATRPAPVTQPVAEKHPPVDDKHLPVVEKREPVAPPPPPPPQPAQVPVAPVVEPVAHVPTTQPAAPPAGNPPVAPPAPMVAATQPGPIDDRVAYAIGYSAGRRIRDRMSEDGRTVNDMQVIKGVIDGLSDYDPAYPRAEVLEAFAEFQAYTQQRRAEKLYADNPAFRKHADENLQKSRALLDQNAKMAGVDVRPDGVQLQTITAGNGRVVGNAKSVTVKHLRVSLADGTLVEASTDDQPDKIVIADALPALVSVIRQMKVNGKCRVWLPADKAYGLTGKAPVIGPNQAIEYELELVNAE